MFLSLVYTRYKSSFRKLSWFLVFRTSSHCLFLVRPTLIILSSSEKKANEPWISNAIMHMLSVFFLSSRTMVCSHLPVFSVHVCLQRLTQNSCLTHSHLENSAYVQIGLHKNLNTSAVYHRRGKRRGKKRYIHTSLFIQH